MDTLNTKALKKKDLYENLKNQEKKSKVTLFIWLEMNLPSFYVSKMQVEGKMKVRSVGLVLCIIIGFWERHIEKQ